MTTNLSSKILLTPTSIGTVTKDVFRRLELLLSRIKSIDINSHHFEPHHLDDQNGIQNFLNNFLMICRWVRTNPNIVVVVQFDDSIEISDYIEYTIFKNSFHRNQSDVTHRIDNLKQLETLYAIDNNTTVIKTRRMSDMSEAKLLPFDEANTNVLLKTTSEFENSSVQTPCKSMIERVVYAGYSHYTVQARIEGNENE